MEQGQGEEVMVIAGAKAVTGSFFNSYLCPCGTPLQDENALLPRYHCHETVRVDGGRACLVQRA
ncbi:MAG: hypothetical protein M3R24_41770, partial [Chloroflexota bacterium]|nr:hypothetical protein [Chloroflexota bacterium]